MVFQAVRDRVGSWFEPVPQEALDANARRWDMLAPDLRTVHQVLGIQSAGCGATVGVMERCDFYCTACYLPHSSQKTPPLPFEQVKEQIDAIRGYLGPTGNIQLTAGEVTLLPREDLGRIVKYCLDQELKPMVMTNGQTMLRDPSYLEYLMECGLTKVAIHVDTTQRGRDGHKPDATEKDLHWIRDEFADLIRHMRKKTGRTLHAAHTFTVTQENQRELDEVVRWSIANADAFRLLSLQPTADTGRTRIDRQGGDVDGLWKQVCKGAGKSISRAGMTFGHPSCNTVTMHFVVKYGGRTQLVEFLEGKKDVRFFHELLRKGFGSFTPMDEDSRIDAAMKAAILLARQPRWLWEVPHYIMHRMHTERGWLGDFLRTVLTGGDWEINPYALIVHNFMSADELQTEEGQARLAACAFRIPFQGEMVSMCEFNGSDMRETSNTDIRRDFGEDPTPGPGPEIDEEPEAETESVPEPEREGVLV